MALFKHSALVISINSLSQTQTCNHILCHYRPMGAFGSDRFSFAATFGALTYLCFEIAVKRHYVVRNANHGPFNIQSKCCQLYYQKREREGERERAPLARVCDWYDEIPEIWNLLRPLLFGCVVLGAVVSIIVYTLDYFPLLVALADKTSLGDFLGTLYIWTMTSLYVIQRLGCYGVEVGFNESIIERLIYGLTAYL